MKNITNALLVILAVALVATPAFAQKVGPFDAPTVTATAASQVSLYVTVTAGASGAPAGFSLQWMTLADFEANGNQWYSSDALGLCKGSFSGNANLSRYELGANESVTVEVGDMLLDNGASTSCDRPLTCGTTYVFRSFAHADKTRKRSDFSANSFGTTGSCGHADTCTLTQGYWKNHAEEWPVTMLTLGTVSYDQEQLLAIFNTSGGSNFLVKLAHQLIAAKLNVAAGADPTDATAAIAAADIMIGDLVVAPIGSGSLSSATGSALNDILSDYNEGVTGPGHCD